MNKALFCILLPHTSPPPRAAALLGAARGGDGARVAANGAAALFLLRTPLGGCRKGVPSALSTPLEAWQAAHRAEAPPRLESVSTGLPAPTTPTELLPPAQRVEAPPRRVGTPPNALAEAKPSLAVTPDLQQGGQCRKHKKKDITTGAAHGCSTVPRSTGALHTRRDHQWSKESPLLRCS